MMKWSGSMYGFEHITEISTAIKNIANQRDFVGVISQLGILKDFLERMEIIHWKIIDSSSSFCSF
jgi:hypothetical protein